MRAAAAATLRTLPRVALSLPPKLRRRLVILLAVAAVLTLVYMAWFRDSSLVHVEKVTVTGLTTERAPQIRAALTRAARGMTTLHVDEVALRRAVASDPIVRNITVQSDFPHGLKIDVTENVPRALLVGPSRKVAVAGNGTVLTGQPVDASLPVIRLEDPPATGRVGNPSVAELVEAAGAAPLGILSRLSQITRRPGKGIVAQVRRGPVIYLGDATQLEVKWADAVAILADRGSQGAAYVDVRMPGRPVAGGLHIDVTPDPAESADAPPGPTASGPGAVTPPRQVTPQSATPQAATPQAAAPPAAATPQAGPASPTGAGPATGGTP